MKTKTILNLTIIALFTLLMSACGHQPKPNELLQLEEMRLAKQTAKINKNAPKEYDFSTELYDKSVKAWQNRDQQVAAAYAVLAQRQYVAAQATSDTVEAQNNIDAAKKEINDLTKELETLKAKKEGLTKSIALINQNLSNTAAANVEQKILMAQNVRQKADAVQAKDIAPEDFNAADQLLVNATNLVASGQRDAAAKAADEAIQRFQKAHDLAKPTFDKSQASAKSAEKQKAILDAGTSAVGMGNAFQDHRGIVLVLPASFDRNKSTLFSVHEASITSIAKIAKDHPEISIIVEGYTQSNSKNPSDLSRRRAETVRDQLLLNGVDIKRIVTTSKGKEQPRYDNKDRNERAKNDRVEIIFVL